MSNQVKVLLPKLGESIHSATVVRWFKNVGDDVRLDEPLLEVSTDKVNSEIPSPAKGRLASLHAQVDQELPVGALLATIEVGNVQSSGAEKAVTHAPYEEKKPESDDRKGVYSPAFLRLVKEHGLSMSEVEAIPGSGIGGRVTKNDLEEYVARKGKKGGCPFASAQGQSSSEVERVQMSGMRKAIAENMVRSFYEAPHATLVTEVDITWIIKRIEREKESFQKEHGCKLTITAFIAEAIVAALKEFPLINSSLDGDTILVKKFVNLGIAVSVGQGLFVPVIKQAQAKNLAQLAQGIGEVSRKAREQKLLPDDVKEGTITITNFGMSGVQIGVPIIRYPEVAIVGVGAVSKKVVPLENDLLAVRSMVHISLTFDHRVLDGMYGCGFLNALKTHLERSQRVE